MFTIDIILANMVSKTVTKLRAIADHLYRQGDAVKSSNPNVMVILGWWQKWMKLWKKTPQWVKNDHDMDADRTEYPCHEEMCVRYAEAIYYTNSVGIVDQHLIRRLEKLHRGFKGFLTADKFIRHYTKAIMAYPGNPYHDKFRDSYPTATEQQPTEDLHVDPSTIWLNPCEDVDDE